MTTPTPPTRPGWYPDPEGGPRQRYWDGSEWHTQAPSAKLAASREWAAQQRAEQQLADTTRFAHIPPPAGSQQTSHWERDRRGKDGDNWTRSFEGTSRMVYGVEVGIVGTQRDDGRVTRRVITIHSGGADLKADTALQVAAALIDAADELDQLG